MQVETEQRPLDDQLGMKPPYPAAPPFEPDQHRNRNKPDQGQNEHCLSAIILSHCAYLSPNSSSEPLRFKTIVTGCARRIAPRVKHPGLRLLDNARNDGLVAVHGNINCERIDTGPSIAAKQRALGEVLRINHDLDVHL